ncbi:MAG: hypothetical protein INF64_09485 [Roseomonas sp.]|nr:hypothetical protein [Roseomonas sp.]
MTRKLPPGLGHAAIGTAFTAIIGIPCALAGLPAIIGAAFAIGFYVGRERRQTEEWKGSNRVSPLIWKPRAWRDMGWPALSATATAIVIEYFT